MDNWGPALDCHLDLLLENLERWEQNGLEINPDFQRGHVWTEEQQISFVEFLLRGGDAPPLVMNTDARSLVPTYLVDGLQRLTAVTRFLKNEIKAFGHYLDEFEDRELLLRKNRIRVHKVFFENRRDLLTAYIELNSGGVVHTEEELDRVRELLEKETAQG